MSINFPFSFLPASSQHTIQQIVDLRGRGLFTSQNVRIRFLPADVNTGIRFQRIDLPDRPVIDSHITNLLKESRHTVLSTPHARVETIEHVLAALAGLGIDNCLIQMNAAEPPNCDGSSCEFVKLLHSAEVVSQEEKKLVYTPLETITLTQSSGAFLEFSPAPVNNTKMTYLRIDYHLDYGPESGISRQAVVYSHTNENFVNEISPSRTFIEEHEINQLRAMGYGKLTSNQDLLVFNKSGDVLGNTLRYQDECARHKILDFIGDISLCGVAVTGYVKAFMSGHALNHQMAEVIHRHHQLYLTKQPQLVLT